VNSGIYIAVLYLPKTEKITVGRLDTAIFKKGFYFYVGSAQRNLSSRLERHAKKTKPMRWHIDYLSARTNILGAIIMPKSKVYECKIAKELGNLFKRSIDGFGASDCKCSGHLFYAKDLAKI
jgi:sugar fermentation stimulation protein A